MSIITHPPSEVKQYCLFYVTLDSTLSPTIHTIYSAADESLYDFRNRVSPNIRHALSRTDHVMILCSIPMWHNIMDIWRE